MQCILDPMDVAHGFIRNEGQGVFRSPSEGFARVGTTQMTDGMVCRFGHSLGMSGIFHKCIGH